ncbi:C5a anaphylatoxin chemotactic receptor 1-like [Pleurodeles waltl]|uniref:C5a anaphylatoxin chemotactic receptor 1-like n=1 Tax=Pleurodeles waltl TaxID=8319 RepID=UPI003709AE0C
MAYVTEAYDDYEYVLRLQNETLPNVTDKDLPPSGSQTYVPVFSIGLYCLIFLLGVPGNVAVIWIIGFKVKRTAGNIWFLNLSIADLLCCLALPFVITMHAMDLHWPFGNLTCKVIPSLTLLNAYASILILTMISIDRWILVMWPVWCQNKRTLTKASITCVTIWSVALLLTSPSFIFRHLSSRSHKMTCDLTYGDQHSLESFISIFRFVLAFLIPFLVITICNCLIFVKVQRSWHSRSNKTLKVILTVVFTFFVCWFPHQVVLLILGLYPPRSALYIQTYKLHSFVVGLAYINSCINPIIYVIMGHDFKDQFKKSLRKGLIRVLADDYSQIKASNAKAKSKAPSGEEKSMDSSAL